jgi:hypothetical protein
MSLLRYALPALLLLYFLRRSLRQRVFLLGIPFLMFMSFSVFFDKLKPFWVPGRLSPADHLMLWLVITWVLYFDLLLPKRLRTLRERQLFGPRLSWPEEALLVGLAGYVVVQIVVTALQYKSLGSALFEAEPFLYLMVGYCLLRGICCRAGREETLDFIAAIVVVNTIASGLFVLHQGLHKPIYIATEYQSFVFMGQRLTRSFYFMPQFLPLAIAYCVAKRKWGVFWTGCLVVTLAAVWVSYTRSWLFIGALEIAAVLGARFLKAREVGPAIRRVLQILAVAALFGVLVFALLPTQSAYLLSRIRSTTSSGSAVHDTDLQNRVTKIETTYQWIGSDGRLQGAGFASAAQDPRVTEIEAMASDIVWVPLLYRLGLLGVVGFACLFIVAGWRATSLSLSVGGDAEFLSVVLLGTIVGLFLQGFVSWTILDPARTPMALWFLALLTAERSRRQAEAAQSQPVAISEPYAVKRIVNG